MKGMHDDELTWPLIATSDIMLLNQIRDREHHLATVRNDECRADRVTQDDKIQFSAINNLFPMKTSTRSLAVVSISKMIVSFSKLTCTFLVFITTFYHYSIQ